MHPNGARKKSDDQAIFSKAGPNLSNPDVTNNPRVIPNRYRLKKRKISDIVKITSGSNLYSSKIVSQIYSLIIKAGTHRVESIKIAEAAKVIENTQRDLNIALINELSTVIGIITFPKGEVIKLLFLNW